MIRILVCVAIVSRVCHASAVLPVANPGAENFGVEENVVDGAGSQVRSPFEECFRKDSISCLQMNVFRMARNFFDQPTYNLSNGLTIVNNDKNEGRSFHERQQTEEKFEKARGFEEREEVLESYLVGEVTNFFTKRNFNWNLGSLGRSIANETPDNFKTLFKAILEEGRGRRKVLKMLVPFLFGLKVKFATVLGLVYLGVILLAKKALALALISISLSVFQVIKKMFENGHGYSGYAPHGGYGGWQSHIDVGNVEYAPHPTTSAAQNIAYGGQKNISS